MFEANNQNSVSQHGRDLAVKFERDIDNQVLIVSNDSGMSHVKVNRLTDAQDPVVFVAHSLGGIIVKDVCY